MWAISSSLSGRGAAGVLCFVFFLCQGMCPPGHQAFCGMEVLVGYHRVIVILVGSHISSSVLPETEQIMGYALCFPSFRRG